jgi:hypothetical protein
MNFLRRLSREFPEAVVHTWRVTIPLVVVFGAVYAMSKTRNSDAVEPFLSGLAAALGVWGFFVSGEKSALKNDETSSSLLATSFGASISGFILIATSFQNHAVIATILFTGLLAVSVSVGYIWASLQWFRDGLVEMITT